MEENNYVNDEQYQQKAKKLKKIGKVVLIIGVCIFALGFVCLILGFLGFGKTAIATEINANQISRGIFKGFGLFALSGLLDTLGFVLTVTGCVIMVIAHRREIETFTTKKVIPAAKEGINDIAPAIGNAAGKVVKGFKEGLNGSENKEK